MTIFRWPFVPVTAVALWIVIRHHARYLQGRRPFAFRPFLETAGWLVITLAAAAASLGGLESVGTRVVEVSAFMIGVIFVVTGSRVKQAPHT